MTSDTEEVNNSIQKVYEKGDIQDKIQTTDGRLPEKVFVARDSLLTELFKNKHIKTVYHCFAAFFIGLVVDIVAKDYLKNGEVRLGLKLLQIAFAKLHLALGVWTALFVTTFLIFYGFNLWSKIRCTLKPNSFNVYAWDRLCLGVLVSYYIASYPAILKAIEITGLPGGTVCIILVETTRLLMKVHAFVRSNAPDVLNYKPHSEKPILQKEISKYLYFLFAPTLVYRDQYPRTKSIRWSFVFQCVCEVATAILAVAIIIESCYVQFFKNFGVKTLPWQDIVLAILGSTLSGTLIITSLFFFVLHSWQNAFAEMLMFADRLFYKDWWTSTTFSRYYRTWNVIVHDWLYTYVYKDLYEHVIQSKWMAKLAVMLISAVIHEMILTYTLNMFFPLTFLLFFGLGAFLIFVNTSDHFIWHALFHFGISLGQAIEMCLYTMEFFARANKPVVNATVVDYLVPRTFTCDCIQY